MKDKSINNLVAKYCFDVPGLDKRTFFRKKNVLYSFINKRTF